MRILAAFALALSLVQPVLQSSDTATRSRATGAQTAAARPTAAESSKVWIGRYAEFEQFLRSAPIKRTEEIGTGVTNPHRAYFAPGGIAGSAIVKDVDEGLTAPYLDRYASEIAAYRLDRLLELDMVPPTVERRLGGGTRSVQLWAENCRSLTKVGNRPAPDVEAWNRQVYRHRVFDDLINNTDRNSGNMLVDPAWNLILIDHSRAFDFRKDKMPFELSRIDRPLFERLKKLDRQMLDSQIGSYLTLGVDPILRRRDRIVKEFEKLIAQHGEANVVIEWTQTAPRTAVACSPAEGVMNAQQILVGAQDALTARRVFGEPIRVDDTTVIPAAVVRGGGGGGGRSADEGGVGFGLNARPAGVYVVKNGDVSWHPAIDVNRIILGGQLVAMTALLALRPLLLRWLQHRLEPAAAV